MHTQIKLEPGIFTSERAPQIGWEFINLTVDNVQGGGVRDVAPQVDEAFIDLTLDKDVGKD